MKSQGNLEAVFSEWMRAQRELIDQWGRTIDSVEAEEARRMVDDMMRTWKKSVDETLEMQRAWASTLAQEIEAMDGVPGEVTARIRDSAEGFSKWADAQGDIWGEWFAMAAEVVPEEARTAGEDIIQTAAAAMQMGFSRLVEANRKIMERMDEGARR